MTDHQRESNSMFRIDFIEDGAEETPLLRLWLNEPADFRRFRDLIEDIAVGNIRTIDLGNLSGVGPLHHWRLTAILGGRDVGVRSNPNHQSFDWVLTAEGWASIAELITSLCDSNSTGSFQWLDRRQDISVLISRDGQW